MPSRQARAPMATTPPPASMATCSSRASWIRPRSRASRCRTHAFERTGAGVLPRTRFRYAPGLDEVRVARQSETINDADDSVCVDRAMRFALNSREREQFQVEVHDLVDVTCGQV